MRKRNHTVTIRMNKEEYELLQSKVKESGRTQQEVVIKAIADLKIASTEEVEELKRLNQMFADILSQLRGATTNINQIARKLNSLSKNTVATKQDMLQAKLLAKQCLEEQKKLYKMISKKLYIIHEEVTDYDSDI